ncbi:glycosyltransferase family 9 protein [Fundidesulfovibrio butyratiphilus]
MKNVLVIQLARLGDLVQTKRLVRSLSAQGPRVHLLVDRSLGGLAVRIYPRAEVHVVDAHSRPDPQALLAHLSELRDIDFKAVYNLNFSGLNLALSTLFDPDRVRGHVLRQGQPHRDPLTALAFRLTARRRPWGVNLADLWAAHAVPMVDPGAVNPEAEPGGRGLGVVLAGRQARRSLPPEALACLVAASAGGLGGKARIVLFGSSAERSAARALIALLPARLQGVIEDLTGRTSLADLPEALSGLDRLLTPDTGLMHVAAHVGVPITAFFLSSAWCHETGPYGRGHTVWQAVTECAPCLESAPCENALACLEPFKSRELLRQAAGRGGEPPAGLSGYRTDLDALGAVNALFAGRDPGAGSRARLRGYLARRLGVEAGQALPAAPDLEESLSADTDVFLPHRPGPFPGPWSDA